MEAWGTGFGGMEGRRQMEGTWDMEGSWGIEKDMGTQVQGKKGTDEDREDVEDAGSART